MFLREDKALQTHGEQRPPGQRCQGQQQLQLSPQELNQMWRLKKADAESCFPSLLCHIKKVDGGVK